MYDDKGGDQGLYWLPYMSSTYTKLMAGYAGSDLENMYGGQVFDAAKEREQQLTAALLGFNYQDSSEYADRSFEE
jgi:hypothetical protein